MSLRASICLLPRLLIISSVVWHDMDSCDRLNKLQLLYGSCSWDVAFVSRHAYIAIELKHIIESNLIALSP